MGREFVAGKITASLSRTNSPKDVAHAEAWKEFADKVRHIASNPKYKDILLNVDFYDPELD